MSWTKRTKTRLTGEVLKIDQETVNEILSSMLSMAPRARADEPDAGPAFGTVFFGPLTEFDKAKSHYGMACGGARSVPEPSVPFKPMTSKKPRGWKAVSVLPFWHEGTQTKALEIDPRCLPGRRNAGNSGYTYAEHSFILVGWPDIRINRSRLRLKFRHECRLPDEVVNFVKEKMGLPQ